MTVRADIRNNRLIYTCNCGWIDLGHANPASRRPHVGAQSLWNEVNSPKENERFVVASASKAALSERYAAATGAPASGPEFNGYRVTYKQDMSTPRVLGLRLTASSGSTYVVRHGLSPAERKSVALAIFMEVSFGFEGMQGSWPYSWTRAAESSFSQEDLVSNLLGFYSIVEPSISYLELCHPVGIDASEVVWDQYGGVSRKNRSFSPIFQPCRECREHPVFPSQLQMITAARKGDKFFDFFVPLLMSARWR